MKILKILFILPLVLMSCSSDDDGANTDDGSNPIIGNKNGYSITIEGSTFANSWGQDMDNEDGIVSTYLVFPDQPSLMSVVLTDDTKDFDLLATVPIDPKTNQPFPLGLEDDETVQSTVYINVNDKHYVSQSGSLKLSNFKPTMMNPTIGFAAYDMIIDGKFDIVDTEEVEQIHIKGAIKSLGLF